LPFDVQLIIFLTTGCQLDLVGLGLQPMIILAKQLQVFPRHLYTAQSILPAWHLRIKLKVFTAYEVFHVRGENSIGFTIGPLARISNSALFEVKRPKNGLDFYEILSSNI